MHWTLADVSLVLVVTTMGAAIAYLQNPEQKATVLMLPVPFTLTTLSVGKPIDCINVLAIGGVFGYTILVWLLHERLRVPIIAAIAVAVMGYCLLGTLLVQFGPSGCIAFWVAIAGTVVTGAVMLATLPNREGRQHRTPLPVWVKAPALAAVASGLIEIKHVIGGFATMFPLVGIMASYESRHSLWTIVRRMAWVLLLKPSMLAVIWLLQPHVGLTAAIFLSWPVYLAGLWAWHQRPKTSLAAGGSGSAWPAAEAVGDQAKSGDMTEGLA